MNENYLKGYWSAMTAIPLSQFRKSGIRLDSGGRKRDGYMGVCVVDYHSMEVRRLLDAIGEGVIDELLGDKVE